jgi:hypothetical protein
MKPTKTAQKASRQCWECLKRRLVCDFTLPHCNKCLKAGRQCSGYDEKKPLQWVEPGQALSRKRRKAPSKELEIMGTSHSRHSSARDSSSDDNSDDTSILVKEYVKLATTGIDEHVEDDVFSLADRITIELVVSENRQEDAKKILKKAETPAKALKSLEQVLRYMEQEDIPSYNLRSDTCEVVQAVHYGAAPHYPCRACKLLTGVQ